MSAPIEIVSIISIKPGNIDRVIQELTPFTEHVEASEPAVLRYQMYRQINATIGTENLVFIEIFASQKALDSHRLSDAYKTMQMKGAELGLLLAPPDVKVLEACGGFGLRGVEGLFGVEGAKGM